MVGVAPARERGLKCPLLVAFLVTSLRRSREGAWIEMSPPVMLLNTPLSRSREGAWIEIVAVDNNKVGDWSLPRGSVD